MKTTGSDPAAVPATPRPVKFSLAANYDLELVPALAPYPVDEVYGRFPTDGVSRTGEGCGEYINNQVAEILSRSRKVRTRIPNKTNFVTARDDGAKGQRPPQGRAGAGLASPAGLTFKKSCSLFQTCNKFFQFSQSAAVTKF
jgi:hypothetical protein